jgi:2-dehydropantoate 2-reductase
MSVAAGRRIAVVGVGAIGGAIAADLADRGRHELALCARSPFERLQVRHPGGVSEVEIEATTAPESAVARFGGAPDWVLLVTKAQQSAGARPWLTALCGPTTRVAVLQNGVDHVERVQPLVPDGTEVLPVVIQVPCERTAPGRVEQSHPGLLFVPDTAAGQAFAALFAGGRTQVRPTADFESQAWWKLLANAAIGGVCALAVRPNRVAGEPDVRALVLELMREVAAVGRAEGAVLPPDAPEKCLERMLSAAPDHWGSIALDRREGRPMEWEARNAVVGRLGRRHGIATPLNDAITTLLRLADSNT